MKFGARLWLVVAGSVSLVAIGACGSAAEQRNSSSLSESPTPVPTFVRIQVTSAIGAEPTAEVSETAEAPVISRGDPRPFPEILKQTDGLSIGPVLSAWQTYLTNSVFVFDENAWDLCANLRGSAEGSIVAGVIVWTIGPPTPELKSNEITFGVWSPIQEKGMRTVLGTDAGSPVMKMTEPWNQYSSDPIIFTGEEIPFDVHELIYCTDPRS